MGGRKHQAALALALAAACGGGGAAAPQPTAGPRGDETRSPDDGPPSKSEQEQKDEEDAAIIAIEQAVNQLNPAIHQCWARAAADDYRLSGVVVLAVRVGAGGKTESVKPVEDSPGDPVLVECLSELWKKYTWPSEAIAAGETVQLPMEFGAPEAQYTVSSSHVAPRPLGADGPAAASKAQVLLHADNTGNDAGALSVLEMAPGMTIPLHRHPSSIEIIYVLSGRAVMTDISGGERPVGPGDAIYMARGTPHGFKNTGGEPVVAVQLYAPGGPEQRFLGKPARGTEPIGLDETLKRAGKRPIIKATRSGRSEKLAAGKGKRTSLFEPGQVFAGALNGQAGMELKAEADGGGSWFWYLLEGGGVLTINGQDTPVGPGDAIQIPSGIRRAFKAGPAGVKALQFRVDGDPGARWRPRGS
ncbi:MAG TPA: cupin domain-containing protein [Kofleriaceae bacterium]|nr:cupin domain-containing protein [Kofleriaceae bacterium]